MASLLTKKLSSVRTLFLSYRHYNLAILTPLFRFSTQIQQKDGVSFIAQYLISSFGFSMDRALRVAADKNLAPIKTPERPESVVRFLKDTGLTDTQIKSVISSAPSLLSRSVSKTLEPWARQVITGGFTRDTLIQLIRYNPTGFNCTNPLPRLQFWRDFVGSEEAFLKLIKKWMVINLDIDKKIIPRINLLREYGWSEEEMQNILKQYPIVIALSEENVKSKMNFLTEKAGLNLKCIVGHPALLAYSLQKRLLPRHNVLSLLKSKGLIKKCDLCAVVSMSEIDFMKRFIERYEKEVPDLAKTYAAACAGKNA